MEKNSSWASVTKRNNNKTLNVEEQRDCYLELTLILSKLRGSVTITDNCVKYTSMGLNTFIFTWDGVKLKWTICLGGTFYCDAMSHCKLTSNIDSHLDSLLKLEELFDQR